MDANQNPPSEREWTIEEQEEFFASQDDATGFFSGCATNSYPNASTDPLTLEDCTAMWARFNQQWANMGPRLTGIHVTSITPPESGWPMAIHCPLCRETTFFLSPYACKPTEDGKEFDGYHVIQNMCGNEQHAWEHNMRMGMKGWNEPIDLTPDPIFWWK